MVGLGMAGAALLVLGAYALLADLTVKRLRWAPEDWPSWASSLSAVWQRTVCSIFGHDPVHDHCGIPDHDFCAWCQKSMPGKAAREVGKEKR